MKAIYLRGKFNDLNDIVKLARKEGKKIFRCERVRIDPVVAYRPQGVVVLIAIEKE